MADACKAGNLPKGLDLYGTYVDGACEIADGTAVRISSIATNAGNTGDCEPGNPGWSVWVRWVEQRRAAGVTPTIYCMDDGYGGSFWNGWRHADGVAAFQQAGVPEPQWWVSHPGATSIPSYAVAVQNEINVQPGYDLSLVLDYVPGWDAGPAPIQETPEMTFYMATQGQPLVLVDTTSGFCVPLAQQPTGQGLPPINTYGPQDYAAIMQQCKVIAERPAAPAITGSGQITGTYNLT